LKIATCGQLPKGPRVAALACSGGDAAFIADYSETNNLELPQLNQGQKEKFRTVLPKFANVANPLDFTTVIWGNESALRTCAETMLDSDVDFGFLILDYPTEESGEREQCDLMADIFQQTLTKLSLPGAVASSFPELMPKATRDRLHSHGIPALQGVEDGLAAIARVMQYNICREQILAQSDGADQILIPGPVNTDGVSIDEWESKKQLSEFGLKIPEGRLVNKDQVKEVVEKLGCPVAIKIVSHEMQHKTEMGAVAININSSEEAVRAVEEMIQKLRSSHPNLDTNNLIVEKMLKKPVAELLIGIKREHGFGFALVIGSGGTMVELSQDSTTLLLPASKEAVEQALKRLKIAKVLDGFRGQTSGDMKSTVEAIMTIAKYAHAKVDSLLELDVNPLMVMEDDAIAVDAYIRLASKK
jgi:acyl-CoA synthetase (NDP forming)